MKKKLASLFAIVLAAATARADVVGAMADSAAGTLYPAAVESRIASLEALASAPFSCIATNFDGGQASGVEVDGHVVAIYSDAETSVASHIRFDTNFPASRLSWENWVGSGTTLYTDATNGFSGRLDWFTPHDITNGCAFYVENDETPHFIDWISPTRASPTVVLSAVHFHPALETNATYNVVAVRAAVLDQFGIHSGEEGSTNMTFSTLASSPSGDRPALATADGTTIFMSYYYGGVWKSVDGGASWTQLASSPSGDRPALATADGTTIFMSYNGGKTWKSVDGGASWTQLASSPSGDWPALATADGTTIFMAYDGGKTWKSVDGGASWTQLASSPSGDWPALATADGTTIFMSYNGGKVWKSTDGGASWTQLASSPSGNNPALATADGTTIFMSYSGGKVWKSTDGGASWTQLASSPSGNYPALATADGTTVYYQLNGSRLYKTQPIFLSDVTEPFTATVVAVNGEILKIKDFAATLLGKPSVFWTLKTGEDEWGIWAAGEYPLQWRTTAKKTNGTWYVRVSGDTMEATDATTAEAAISLAIATNALNRAPVSQYSPIYGFDGFGGDTPVTWAMTLVPTVAGNAPCVVGVDVLYSAYGDAMHWDTHHYRVDVAETNPVRSTVKWTGDAATQSEIYYIPDRGEEE